MTDYKELQGRLLSRFTSRSRSLYLGLFKNIVGGGLLAIIIFLVVFGGSVIAINEFYITEENQTARREEHLSDLQDFVDENDLSLDTIDGVSEWIRENPYVFLVIYYKADAMPASVIPESAAPDKSYRSVEFVGARIDDALDSAELTQDATGGGYYLINLSDGQITVALSEYSEEYYFSTLGLTSLGLAALTFIFTIVNYVGVIISRIKRFEGEVTIVSEWDMNYEIISDGVDEIARLSTNVERMRRRMLEHIQSEQEARQANTELITSISHDIRTPLTVLMGYIEMMKEQECDEVMQSYIASTENTAQRLKQLSEDMFKYSLAFGDTGGMISLEEYDAATLFDQLLSEHILLMGEKGYDVQTVHAGELMPDGCVAVTDAQNLMRIVDNIFSNLRKYADPEHPILITIEVQGDKMVLECSNKIRRDTEGAESNGIGLKTCKRLASLVADGFEYGTEGDYFTCRLSLAIRQSLISDEAAPENL